MTPDEPPEDAEPEEEDGEGETFEQFYKLQQIAHRHALPDPLLQALLSVVNKGQMQFSATLFVHGLVVSGLLVDFARFHDEVADFIERNAGGDAGVITGSLRTMSLEHQVASALADDDDFDIREYAFVNVTDANIWQGSQLIAQDVWWRGRLASVDGWCFGHWGPSGSTAGVAD